MLLSGLEHKFNSTDCRSDYILVVLRVVDGYGRGRMDDQVTSLNSFLDRGCIREISIKEFYRVEFLFEVVLKWKHFSLVVSVSDRAPNSESAGAFSVQKLVQNLRAQVAGRPRNQNQRFA